MANPVNSLFTAMQKTVFATAGTVFGHSATWVPAAGGQSYTEQVLFKNPTEAMTLAGVDYDPEIWRMEYSFEKFPGLKESVDQRAATEIVTIETQQYYVRAINTKFDGKTYIVDLQPIE
jgi:hypothetical protein